MTDPILNFSLHDVQKMAFLSEAEEILFGGATRGGKTYFAKIFCIACCHNIPGCQILILRKYYDDVITNFMEGHDGFRRLLAPFVELGIVRLTENTVKWVNTGSFITLTHCSSDEAADKAQGIPKNVLIVEEAPQILERYLRFIRGWVTVDEKIKASIPPDFPVKLPKIIYTGNPIGASMGYFRRNFVKAAPKCKIFTAPLEDGGFKRQYIEARVEDNPYEDTGATQRRVSGMGDPAYYAALCEGNWDAPVGDFFKMYEDKRHTLPDHKPPAHLFKFCTFDWGSAEPFAVCWWYVSDGEPIEQPDGSIVQTRRGALVMYREWYGCSKHDPAKGLDLPNKEIAAGIIERTNEQMSGLVLTDSLPFQSRGTYKNGREYNIADEFGECGVILTKGNTQRIKGWKAVKDRLLGQDGFPMLLFCQCCKYARDYLPALQRHKTNFEDAEESGEATHVSDCIRYSVATNLQVKDLVEDAPKEFHKPTPPTMEELEKRIIRRNLNKRGHYARRYHCV